MPLQHKPVRLAEACLEDFPGSGQSGQVDWDWAAAVGCHYPVGIWGRFVVLTGGGGTVDSAPQYLGTMLVDLSEFSLEHLPERGVADVEASTRIVLSQVDRPRRNTGGTGPPGRVD